MNIFYRFLILIVLCGIVLSAQAQWTNVSCQLSGGASPKAILQLNNKLLLAEQGVFSSADNGISWDSSSIGLPAPYGSYSSVYTLVKSSSKVFAGINGDGVYSSTDNGVTWNGENTGLPSMRLLNCMAVYNGNLFIGLDSGRIYKSTDNGAHWLLSNNGINIAWKQVYTLATTSTGIMAGTYLAGAFFSSDNGNSWTQVNNGLSANPAFYKMVTIGNTIFGSMYGKLFKTTDNGANWTDLSANLPASYDGSILFVSGSSLFIQVPSGTKRSTDEGATWTTVNTGLGSTAQLLAMCDSGSTIKAFFTTTNLGHLGISSDNGDTWTINNYFPLDANVIYAGKSGNDLLVGTSNVGVLKSNDHANHWYYTSYMGGVRAIGMKDSVVFASLSLVLGGGTVAYRSTDYGETWAAQTTSMGLSNEGIFAYGFNDSYAFLGTGSNTGTSGIYRSSNMGTSWSYATTGLTTIPGARAFARMGSVMFAGATNVLGGIGVYKSTNNGGNWVSSSTGLPSTTIPVCPITVSGGTIYAMIQGMGLYKSNDSGATWTDISAGLTNAVNIYGIAASGSNVFAMLAGTTADGNGLFVSSNQGSTWSSINAGLPNDVLFSNVVLADSIIFACGNKGVWKRPVSDFITDVKEINTGAVPTAYKLEQNYPNPFNPNTLIRYSVPTNSVVSLKVYTMLGQEVSVLVNNEIMNQGVYEARFDASTLSSGVYFYRLSAIGKNTSFSETKAMILSK